MKVLHLFLVALFTCTVCLFAASGEVLAAEKKPAPPTVATDTTGQPPAAPLAKPTGKAKKEIPTDVDINTADKAILTGLPGIGPVTADAILAYRQANGNFKNLDELTKVKGIGDKTLVKLKPYLHEI